MFVPSTADGFRAVVSALCSLDGAEGVNFHTLTLLKDRCVQLLVKKRARVTPESVVREELEFLNVLVQGVIQLRFGRRDQYPAKDRPPTPTSLSRWRDGQRCHKSDQSPNSGDLECHWSRTWPRKAHCNSRAVSTSDTRSVTAVTHTGVSLVAVPTFPVVALSR
jgi:hypothetical protein